MPSVQRRAWDDASKRQVIDEIAAAVAKGMKVTEACKRADVSDGLYYQWRKQFSQAANGAPAPVAVKPPLQLTSSIGIGSISADELTRLRAEHAKMKAFIGEMLVDTFLEQE